MRCHINVVEAVVVYAKPYGKAWQGMARQPKVEARAVIKDLVKSPRENEIKMTLPIPNTSKYETST